MDFSIQLYSGRNFPPIENIIARSAALGYKQAEGFGGLYADAEGLAKALKSNGMTMPTGHFGIDQLEDTSTALKWAEQLGVKLIVCPWIAPEARGEDNATWTALGERLARLGETYRKAGYRFGWHNHDFEFKPTREGRLPMDILMETAPENDWEMDVAWVVRGGADPVAWLKKYGSRITAVHVKDIAPAGQAVDEGGWADAGHGTIDWNTLQREIKTHAKAQYWVMEHDNPSDFDRFARRSLESARQWR